MASFGVPCPKILPLPAASLQPSAADGLLRITVFSRSDARSMLPRLQQAHSQSLSDSFKVCAQLNVVAIEKSSNSIPAAEALSIKESGEKIEVQDASSLSVFMSQVSDLVKLVDSRDVVELQIKQMDCELVVRKKEALPQPSIAAPVTTPPKYQAILPPQLPPANAPAFASSVPSLPAPLPAPAAPAKPKSSYPPFKCPMAGNLYRSPAPGAPPFVKVGDKIQKGQVICIIEAMKLMNEIEADQSGTVVDILVEDGKPVSMDLPLFIIEP